MSMETLFKAFKTFIEKFNDKNNTFESLDLDDFIYIGANFEKASPYEKRLFCKQIKDIWDDGKVDMSKATPREK